MKFLQIAAMDDFSSATAAQTEDPTFRANDSRNSVLEEETAENRIFADGFTLAGYQKYGVTGELRNFAQTGPDEDAIYLFADHLSACEKWQPKLRQFIENGETGPGLQPEELIEVAALSVKYPEQFTANFTKEELSILRNLGEEALRQKQTDEILRKLIGGLS